MATVDNLPLMQGAQPSHVNSGAGDTFLLGSEVFKDNPFLLNRYFKQPTRNMTLLQKVSAFFPGRFNAVSRASYSPWTGHYEKPMWKKTITIGSIAAGANADEAVITLTAADMVTDDNAHGMTYVRSYPRKNDTIQGLAGGQHYHVIAKDKTVNPHTITVKSRNGSDPADELAEGQVVMVGPPTFAEGTRQPEGLVPRRVRYKNRFVIIKETDGVSGSHMTSTASFTPVPGSNLLFLEGLQDMEKRHQYGKGYKWLFDDLIDEADMGNIAEYSDVLWEEAGMSSTQGLIPYIQQSGRVYGYDPNDFGIEDLYELAEYFHDINVGSSEILLAQGTTINRLIEQSLADRLNYEWVIGVSDKYVTESMRHNWAGPLDREYDPHGAFLNLGINGFVLNHFTFLQTAVPEFNDARGPGAIGYKDWMIATPFGTADVENDSIPYLGYEYRGAEGYNREDEVWVKSGAGNARVIRGYSDFNKTSEIDGTFFYERSEIAAHFALGEQMALFTPTGASS